MPDVGVGVGVGRDLFSVPSPRRILHQKRRVIRGRPDTRTGPASIDNVERRGDGSAGKGEAWIPTNVCSLFPSVLSVCYQALLPGVLPRDARPEDGARVSQPSAVRPCTGSQGERALRRHMRVGGTSSPRHEIKSSIQRATL